jgi:hypothetical protein
VVGNEIDEEDGAVLDPKDDSLSVRDAGFQLS